MAGRRNRLRLSGAQDAAVNAIGGFSAGIVDDAIPSPERTSMRFGLKSHLLALVCLAPTSALHAEVMSEFSISTPQPAEISSFFFSASEEELTEMKNAVYPPRPGSTAGVDAATVLLINTPDQPGLLVTAVADSTSAEAAYSLDGSLRSSSPEDQLNALLATTGLTQLCFENLGAVVLKTPDASSKPEAQTMPLPASDAPEKSPQEPAVPQKRLPAVHIRRPILLSGK